MAGPAVALDRSNPLIDQLLEAMPGGLVYVVADGSIATANAEALRVLGLSYDALTQRYTSDFESETIWEDGTPCSLEDYPVTRALVTGEPQPPATIGVRRHGVVSWAVFTALPVKQPDTGEVAGALVTFLDITERKRTEDRLRVADRLASLGLLAAGVAHEINNPLTYLLSNLARIGDEVAGAGDVDRAAIASAVAEAEDGARRIELVVRELGILSRSDDDDSLVNLREVVDAAVRIAQPEIRYRATVVRDDGAVPPVLASSSRLCQLVVNLLVNAMQAIEVGEVASNEVRISTRTGPTGAAIVEVADTGPGISDELMARLFEPFVTTRARGGGTGLGLYICRGIAVGCGGSLEAENRPEGGAVFRLRLPPAPAEARSFAAPRPSSAPRPGGAVGYRLLLVDDEPAIRRALAASLDADCTVVQAASGREALEAIRQQCFDVVICDLIMPDLSGMELHEQVRRERPALGDRFVFMTGGAFTEGARAFAARVEGRILQKPFPPAALRELIVRVAPTPQVDEG